MTDVSDVSIVSDQPNLKILDAPTKHSAKCIFCECKLSGFIPRLYILRHTYRFGLTNGYMCMKCAKINYNNKQDMKIINQYKTLLCELYKEIMTIEEL